jgi:hypothetical protein
MAVVGSFWRGIPGSWKALMWGGVAAAVLSCLLLL